MRKAALIVGFTLALAGCATTPQPVAPAKFNTHAAPAAPALPDSRRLIVDKATAMIGQPYRYGGAAPGGFDCSGLVVYASGGAGIRLPRTAHEQLREGVPVARKELQPGDLVFMHLSRKELHVGIALGNQRFVHAPSTGSLVRIDSLNAPPYARGYLTARRIVADAATTTASAVQSRTRSLPAD